MNLEQMKKEDIYEILKSADGISDFIDWILCSTMDRDVKKDHPLKWNYFKWPEM